jgi:hypothetical protein
MIPIETIFTLNYLAIEEEENPNRYKSRGISNEFCTDKVAVKVLEKSTIIGQDMAIQICQVIPVNLSLKLHQKMLVDEKILGTKNSKCLL